MNATSLICLKNLLKVSSFTQRQKIVISVINSTIMAGNVISNALVIYILIVTKQKKNITCKLILILSLSDLMIGLFVQNLFTAMLYQQNCVIGVVYMFIMIYFFHLSMYTVAVIGIDRYLRIKHYANFKALWTKRVALTFVSIGSFLALFQSLLTITGLLFGKHYIVVPVYFTIDGFILIAVMFLQIFTIRTSNAVISESTIVASGRITRKVTKLSMQMMLLLCLLVLPHLIISVIHDIIHENLSDRGNFILGFFLFISYQLVFANSSANAILFLITNVKAKRFFKK